MATGRWREKGKKKKQKRKEKKGETSETIAGPANAPLWPVLSTMSSRALGVKPRPEQGEEKDRTPSTEANRDPNTLAAAGGEKVAQVKSLGDFEREWRRQRQVGQKERFEWVVGLSAEAVRAVFRLDVRAGLEVFVRYVLMLCVCFGWPFFFPPLPLSLSLSLSPGSVARFCCKS